MDAKQVAKELGQGAQNALDQHDNPRDPNNEKKLENLYVHVKAQQLKAVCELALGVPSGS